MTKEAKIEALADLMKMIASRAYRDGIKDQGAPTSSPAYRALSAISAIQRHIDDVFTLADLDSSTERKI